MASSFGFPSTSLSLFTLKISSTSNAVLLSLPINISVFFISSGVKAFILSMNLSLVSKFSLPIRYVGAVFLVGSTLILPSAIPAIRASISFIFVLNAFFLSGVLVNLLFSSSKRIISSVAVFLFLIFSPSRSPFAVCLLPSWRSIFCPSSGDIFFNFTILLVQSYILPSEAP